MKKSIFSLMIGAIVALASCSKSDLMPTEPQSDDLLATFQVEAPSTRGAINGLTRYIVEAYEGNDLAMPPVRVETASGSLTITLKKHTDYTLVFWADNGTAKTENVVSSGYWNTDDLRAVVVSSTKKNDVGQTAYCCKLVINSANLNQGHPILLKNATAQVTFVEGLGLGTIDNTLTVTYPTGTKLNVATGEVADVVGPIVHTFTGITQVIANTTLAFDYVLAPFGQENVLNIEVQLNTELKKLINNVPFQQNYKTNIKGEYSNMYPFTFTVTADGDWELQDKEHEFPLKTTFFMAD